MTQEQKDITLHSAPFEMMNRCINFEDGTVDREMMLKAMHTYADMYHRNELSKLHHPTAIGSYAIVRWHDNNKEDVVCSTKEVAEDYVKKYNTLCGEEKCFVDTYVWLPLQKA